MKLVVDLHSHSPYAGASGKVDFPKLRFVMKAKGIDVYGSGDILLKKWEDELDGYFPFDKARGMWNIDMKSSAGCWLYPQTEVIVTLPYSRNEKKRKLFHVIILFPNRSGIKTARKFFEKEGSKLGIGRPFVKFKGSGEMTDFFIRLKKETSCLLVPAHILTPDGILGGKNPVDSVEELFGASGLFDAIESGLSADPDMISRVAGALEVPVISSSDAHSAALNRLGREFTEIYTDEITAEGIAQSVREGKISKTAEFPPFEGRYYLTGHRGDRPGHKGQDVFFIDNPPEICPLCGRPLTMGVKERARDLYSESSERKQDFVYQIPLVEVIGGSLGCGAGSKKVTEIYHDIIGQAGRESAIWLEDDILDFRSLPEEVAEGIAKIKKNRFEIEYGFDGKYGRIIF